MDGNLKTLDGPAHGHPLHLSSPTILGGVKDQRVGELGPYSVVWSQEDVLGAYCAIESGRWKLGAVDGVVGLQVTYGPDSR